MKFIHFKKNQSGFSLLETLVALTILTTTTIYIVEIFPRGLNASFSASQETKAVNLAQAKIEEIISTPYDEISVGTITEASLSALGASFAGYKRMTTVNYVDANLNDSGNNVGLKKIRVDVSWLDGLKKTTATSTVYTLITPL